MITSIRSTGTYDAPSTGATRCASGNTPAPGAEKRSTAYGEKELSSQEKQTVDELKKRDRAVRAHEAAHAAAAGGIAQGGASYTYKTGPDGKQYAVGGEVHVDTSPVRDDPEATIRKMQQVERAALAPADPSAQDRKVAAEAQREAAAARMDARQKSSANAATAYREAGTTGSLPGRSLNLLQREDGSLSCSICSARSAHTHA